MSEDCMSLKNSQFSDYLHLLCLSELEVKDTTKTMEMESYLYIDLFDWYTIGLIFLCLCTFYRHCHHSKYASIKSKYNKSYEHFVNFMPVLDNPQWIHLKKLLLSLLELLIYFSCCCSYYISVGPTVTTMSMT